MHHHEDPRDQAPREEADETAPRERPTDREWNAAGGNPTASSVLGGTASHQRASFNDPATGNTDPNIGTSGLEAQKIAGTKSHVARSASDEWIENPIDQGGFGSRGTDASGVDSEEAAERARRRESAAEARDQG